MSSQNNEGAARGRGSRGRGTRGGRGSRGGRRGRPVSNPPANCPLAEPQPGPSREDPADVLQVVRAQRKLTAKRMAGLTPAQREELASRQQAAQLQRVLMPDAPPRKRSSKPSPPREECEILPTTYAGKKRRLDVPSTSAIEASSREEATEAELLSAVPRVEDLPVVILEPDMPPRVEEDEVDGELLEFAFNQEPTHSPLPYEVDDHQEAGVLTADAAAGPSCNLADGRTINPTHPAFDDVVEEWIRITDDLSDADMDETDENDSLTPMTVGRDATREPATDADLNAFEATVMRTEDRQNDLVLRTIVHTDYYSFEWTNDRETFTGERETFTGTQGPTFNVTPDMRPTDIFYKMFDSDFIDFLCTETNRYAEQKISALKSADKLAKYSRMHRWSPTNRDEMITFLSILILQGLYPSTNEESYFSFNGFGTMPYFSRIMSYNRYLLLKMMLHFVDNDAVPNPSKLTKIQNVTDYLNKKFKDLYYPAQDIVIDESLLKWHGRLGFSQKIASKAAKVGIKTYELCESCSGYLWNFFVYSGKEKQTDGPTDRPTIDEGQVEEDDRQIDDIQDNDRHNDDNQQCPDSATANIVNSLVGPLLNRGHTLIMDNFYNSPLLARYLKKNKTDCFGTLRLNREFVPASLKTLKRTDLRHSEVVASYCSDLSVMVWRDANLVSMISTYHPLQIGAIDKYNRLKYKPNVVLEYNKSMGGVDKKDQVLSAQPIERKRNKVWYKKLFRRLYSTAIFNCYVIFKTAHSTLDHAVFRRALAEDLLRRHRQIDITKEPRLFRQTTMTTTRSALVRPANNRPQLQHNHFPGRTGSKYTRCWWCTNIKKKNSRTSYKCIECDINLCIDDCFREYHTS